MVNAVWQCVVCCFQSDLSMSIPFNSRIPGGEFGHNDFYPVVMAAAQAMITMVKCERLNLSHKLNKPNKQLPGGPKLLRDFPTP